MTTVKELIQQNYDVLKEVWAHAPVGIFSAGLKRKESAFPIVYGGLQSMIKDPKRFGHRDIIFIDEAQLVGPDESNQYQTFLAYMKLLKSSCKADRFERDFI
jgi:DNA repair protein RadD